VGYIIGRKAINHIINKGKITMKKALLITASIYVLTLFFALTSTIAQAQVVVRHNGSTG